MRERAEDEADVRIEAEFLRRHGRKRAKEEKEQEEKEQEDEKKEKKEKIRKDFENKLDHDINDLFLKRVIGKLLFDIAASWALFASPAGGFWNCFDVAFERLGNERPDEAGLTIWDAKFSSK